MKRRTTWKQGKKEQKKKKFLTPNWLFSSFPLPSFCVSSIHLLKFNKNAFLSFSFFHFFFLLFSSLKLLAVRRQRSNECNNCLKPVTVSRLFAHVRKFCAEFIFNPLRRTYSLCVALLVFIMCVRAFTHKSEHKSQTFSVLFLSFLVFLWVWLLPWFIDSGQYESMSNQYGMVW